ncbi:MAG: periplasmic heavy metal sensor [Deltaproteobacteria bacterium]|nr:MAG: periplasmic heavy metal sensor [Deltaproteobacteria bacterium]
MASRACKIAPTIACCATSTRLSMRIPKTPMTSTEASGQPSGRAGRRGNHMTHQAFTTLLLAASLLVPGASALGGSHWRGAMHNGKFWKKSDVRKELHLTDDEVRNFDRIFARDQNKLKDLKADVEKRREDLDAMLVADKVDDKQVLDQVDVLEQARARLGKARAMMVLEMRSVLTPEQRTKLAQLRAERREHERRKGQREDAREPSPS